MHFSLLNAIFMGLSMDSPDAGSGAWFVIDVTFTVIFWLEVILNNLFDIVLLPLGLSEFAD